MTASELIKLGSKELVLLSPEEGALLSKEISNVREEIRDCSYISEALKVLPVKGYRSAIGAYWNAVVDDLRQKILHRSIDLFNKEIGSKKKIEKYEDFQDHVTEYDLIEGAYKIGVLSWEGRKLMHQARETRNMFYGHPKTQEPNLFKVLNLISDCNAHVLSEDFPPSIIDIATYLSQMESDSYDRNEIAVEQAFSDLPSIYKTELSNRFFTTYVGESISSELRANIEFCSPILWGSITKDDKKQIGKRFDKLVVEGNKDNIKRGLGYISLVGGMMYVNLASRKIIIDPLIKTLETSIDDWDAEAKIVKKIYPLSKFIPETSQEMYVKSITKVFVGYKGSSARFSRTDFYSDSAAPYIRKMFDHFDTKSTEIFVTTIKKDDPLKRRIKGSGQLKRLRILGNIIIENNIGSAEDLEFVELLCDDERETEFYDWLFSKKRKG